MSETDLWVPDTSTALKDMPVPDGADDGLPLVWDQVGSAYVPEQIDTVGIKDGAITWNKLAPGAVIAGLDARAYGFVADGVNDDGPALQAAIAAADAANISYLYLGQGTSGKGLGQTSVTLNPNRTGLVMDGAGAGERESSAARSNTTISWIGAAGGTVMDMGDGGTTTSFAVELKNIAINGNDTAGIGIRLNKRIDNSDFRNVLVYGCDVCWDVLNFCFGNHWEDCAVYGFTSRGWKLRNGAHNSTFDHCKAWGNSGLTMVDANPYSVEVGAEGNCSGVVFNDCDFEAWKVKAQVKGQQVSGIEFNGCYMESKDSVADAMIDLGGTAAVNGFAISGGVYTGNTNPNSVFKFTNVSGGVIIGANVGGGALASIINNVSAVNVYVIGDWSSVGVAIANSYTGLVLGSTMAGTDYETLVDLATVTPSGYHNGGNLFTVSQAITIASAGAAADQHTYTFRIKSASSHAITWDPIFRSSLTFTLPAATTGGSKWDYVQFRYNVSQTLWNLVGVVQGC